MARSNGLRLMGWTCNVFEKEPVQMNLKHFYKESHHKFRWCHSVAVLFWKKDANACAGRDLISGIHPWNPKMETPKCQSLKGLHINFKSLLFYAVGPKTVRAVVHFFMLGGVGGWGDNNVPYDIHHVSLSSPYIIMQWLTYALHHTLTEIRMEGISWTQ